MFTENYCLIIYMDAQQIYMRERKKDREGEKDGKREIKRKRENMGGGRENEGMKIY